MCLTEFGDDGDFISYPIEKTWSETLPGNNMYMGKATPVWQLTLSYRCHHCNVSIPSDIQLIHDTNFPCGSLYLTDY